MLNRNLLVMMVILTSKDTTTGGIFWIRTTLVMPELLRACDMAQNVIPDVIRARDRIGPV
jgi:hypothetical protein